MPGEFNFKERNLRLNTRAKLLRRWAWNPEALSSCVFFMCSHVLGWLLLKESAGFGHCKGSQGCGRLKFPDKPPAPKLLPSITKMSASPICNLNIRHTTDCSDTQVRADKNCSRGFYFFNLLPLGPNQSWPVMLFISHHIYQSPLENGNSSTAAVIHHGGQFITLERWLMFFFFLPSAA